MKKPLSLFLLALTFTSAFAQTRTRDVDLSGRNAVPLYDCSIFSSPRDQQRCFEIKGRTFQSWENDGYAVNCFSLPGPARKCVKFAEDLQYDPSRIDCSPFYRNRLDLRRCEITKDAFRNGFFRNDDVRVRTETVIVEKPITRVTTVTTCDERSFDEAMSQWEVLNEAQIRRGKTRQAVGIAATIGGILLGGSNSGTGRAIGAGLTIGGVALTAMGLVDVAEAKLDLPHMNEYCRNDYIVERRMVQIERQECVTTRYSNRTRHSSQYYYEVRCESHRYVTFKEFEPWDRGRAY